MHLLRLTCFDIFTAAMSISCVVRLHTRDLLADRSAALYCKSSQSAQRAALCEGIAEL